MTQTTGSFNAPQGSGGDLFPKVSSINSTLYGSGVTQIIRASALELAKQTTAGTADYTGFYAADTTARQLLNLVKPCHVGIYVHNLDKLVNNTGNPIYICSRSSFATTDSDVFRLYPADSPMLLHISDGSLLWFKTASGNVPFQWFGM